MLSEQEYRQLLEKHLQGACSEEELIRIDEYLAARRRLASGRPQPVQPRALPDHLLTDTFQQISASIDTYENRRRTFRKYIAPSISIAASLILIFGLSYLLYNNKKAPAITYTHITTQKGQRLTVTLPDSSIVILNQESRISYSNQFNTTTREVTLTGEAYFQIAQNAAKPFTVQSGPLHTLVLGTSFNIEAYPSSGKIAVGLITGKVQLKTDSNSYILTPNHAFHYDIASKQGKQSLITDAETYIAWKDGKIRFSNTQLDEAIRRLNLAFKTHIVLKDPKLTTTSIYGDFRLNEQPIDIVRTICILIKARYKIEPDGTITINQSAKNKS
ncbi:MAG TPA: FecR domain-containing protein [Puia sp.]